MSQMYVYSYEQLVAIVNQHNATIGQQAAVINNLRSERLWLEEDNQIQRGIGKISKEPQGSRNIEKVKRK